MQVKNSRKRSKARRNEFEDSQGEPEESDEEDPMVYLDLVKNALYETRSILEDIDENGSLF